jgi:hypothetical protein
MATTRGAAAPTSGAQDHVTEDLDVLDRAVEDVAAHAREWALTSPARRADLLERVMSDTLAESEAWLASACAAKGYGTETPEGGEELFSGIITFVHMARTLRDSLRDLARGRAPRIPGPVRHVPGGRVAVRVVPAGLADRILNAGMTAEVWMEPGVTEEEVRATQAPAYRDPEATAGVSLVLGAGNVASLGPRDVLTKMFNEGRVVVMKANPVNDYLVPHWERALAALIEPGFLRIVRGGAAVGAHLTAHPLVGDVHVTGSDKTYDAIVFGTGEEGAARKAADRPRLEKPVSAELGNVSPVVIVPGEWTRREIEYQARHVATMVTNNAGFNCLTPRVIVTSARWAQRQEFLDALESVFAALPARRSYYPGAEERRAAFVAAHPEARHLGVGPEGTTPWTLIRGVDASDVDDVCHNVEAFCGLTSETALDEEAPAAFLDAAVRYCNETLWGTLSATVLVDPRTMAQPDVAAALERAEADLRYGAVGINVWHAFAFALGTTTWGAYPGHHRTDIQSGSGTVGNALMFARPQKTVLHGPFVVKPDPAWFATRRSITDVMRRYLAYEVDPRATKLARMVAAALRA